MSGADKRTRALERDALEDEESARELVFRIARALGITNAIEQTRLLLRRGWRPFGCPEALDAVQLWFLLEGRSADARAALRAVRLIGTAP